MLFPLINAWTTLIFCNQVDEKRTQLLVVTFYFGQKFRHLSKFVCKFDSNTLFEIFFVSRLQTVMIFADTDIKIKWTKSIVLRFPTRDFVTFILCHKFRERQPSVQRPLVFWIVSASCYDFSFSTKNVSLFILLVWFPRFLWYSPRKYHYDQKALPR